MKGLFDILKKEGYRKIKFKVTKTQHLLIKARINSIQGDFILDTGASNSCVGFECVAHFGLNTKKSKTKAASAGAIGMLTQIAMGNTLKLGRWDHHNFGLVVFDMSHVNAALRDYKAKTVHGIIGADVLLQGQAVIDYYNRYLYLK